MEVKGGGRLETAPSTIARITPKKVSHPALCTYCVDQYRTFTLPGHQDDGERVACGLMIDNMNAGIFTFPCAYFNKKPIAPIIDGETGHPFGHFAGRF